MHNTPLEQLDQLYLKVCWQFLTHLNAFGIRTIIF